MPRPRGLDQLEARAREVLSPGAFAYFSDAAYADAEGRETTAARNLRAWASWYIVPRVLRDVSAADPGTTVLGTRVELPVLTAPCAFGAFAHPEA